MVPCQPRFSNIEVFLEERNIDKIDTSSKIGKGINEVLGLSPYEIDQLKVRLMMKSGELEPVDVLPIDKTELYTWLGWRYSNDDDLNRDYVLGLIRDYRRGVEYWLYSGIYEVVDKNQDIRNEIGYELLEVVKYSEYKFIMIVKYENKSQNMIRNAESIIEDIVIKEILPEEYNNVAEHNIEVELNEEKGS